MNSRNEVHNVSLINKEDCCGCSACFVSCKSGAIKMIPDYEGFLYPDIEQDLCTNCGLCLKVCKLKYTYEETQKIFSCWSKDDKLRYKSSSGGAFTALSRLFIEKLNGVVCGVGYNENKDEVIHKFAHNEKELEDLRRSKFVQSNKNEVYREVRDYLTQDKYVLFTGTPCEVGGLRQFLRKDYQKLITCDLICGCVSSPEVYLKYILEIQDKYNSKVTFVNFKDKRKGWRGKGISILFENGEEYYNSILDDDYVVSFHSRYNIRPSCFKCKYRALNRGADITLGDFWAIEKYNPAFDDNKGTSFVMTNTRKGEEMVLMMPDMEVHELNIDVEDYSTKFNWCMHKNPDAPDVLKRKLFYDDLKSMPFDKVSEKHLNQIKEERKQRKLNL